jgi:hypothetical protein
MLYGNAKWQDKFSEWTVSFPRIEIFFQCLELYDAEGTKRFSSPARTARFRLSEPQDRRPDNRLTTKKGRSHEEKPACIFRMADRPQLDVVLHGIWSAQLIETGRVV